MEALAAAHPVVAWKVYTHTPGPPWRLDDPIGDAFLAKAVELGRPIVCVHKGISGGSGAASPADIGPAAARHPEATLLRVPLGLRVREPSRGPSTRPRPTAAPTA